MCATSPRGRAVEIHRRYARARLGPLASAFEVEVLARAHYEGPNTRPRCPGAVVRAQIDWGFRPPPESERWPEDMPIEQLQRAWHERRMAPHRDCRRAWARRRRLFVLARTELARTELDRLEWAGNLVRHVRTRYYLELIDRVVAGDVASAVSAARAARDRDRVDIGVDLAGPSYEEVFGKPAVDGDEG